MSRERRLTHFVDAGKYHIAPVHGDVNEVEEPGDMQYGSSMLQWLELIARAVYTEATLQCQRTRA